MASILQEISGFAAGTVSLILVVSGIAIASAMSPAAGSPTAVHWALRVHRAAIVLVLISFTAPSPWLAVPTLAAPGFLSFPNVPGLQIYVAHLAQQVRPAAVDVASAPNIAAFNLGIAVGAWIGAWWLNLRSASGQNRGLAQSSSLEPWL